MPAEVLNRAFEPFFTTKDVGKGTGLGLSMVYGFAKQSNGHVSLYSEPGLGTSVRLYLPVAGDAESRPGPAASEAAAPRRTGSETIMVVEDDPFVRNYTVANLENLGYRVEVAANGREALQRLQAGERPDLVFSDVVMPGGVSGWDLAAAIRNLAPQMRVLLTSGYPWETRAGGAGVVPDVAILSKPYGLVELAARIRAALDENR
jgi:CheY-like chemotaxis protein